MIMRGKRQDSRSLKRIAILKMVVLFMVPISKREGLIFVY
jgi:hypothetical protein